MGYNHVFLSHLKGYNHVFLSHFGRGATLGANKYINTSRRLLYTFTLFNFIPIGKYFSKARGLKEKKSG